MRFAFYWRESKIFIFKEEELLHKNLSAEVEIYRSGEAHSCERPVPQGRWSWTYQRAAAHFIQGVKSGEPFCSSGEDTLTDVRLFEQIFKAHLLID